MQREINNHRLLRHPNVVQFREVYLTPTSLAIVMEYAPGGELFNLIVQSSIGRLTENEARFYWQQLISGVAYCHRKSVAHRDLKLENVLLDGGETPRLKICDFGYSKSSLLHSQPKSTVGTPAYIAPEVLSKRMYDGQLADVWSCGVTLYVMLVGAYPFEDPNDPRNFRKTVERILNVQWDLPGDVQVSPACKELLEGIFRLVPDERLSISQIVAHPWFQKNLPSDLSFDGEEKVSPPEEQQTVDEINQILQQAQTTQGHQLGVFDRDVEDELDDMQYPDINSSGDDFAP